MALGRVFDPSRTGFRYADFAHRFTAKTVKRTGPLALAFFVLCSGSGAPATQLTMPAVGIVTGGKAVFHGTGFLVGRCAVVTAKHNAGRVENVIGRRMKFRMIAARGRQFSSKASVVLAGDFDLTGNPFTRDRSGDWMLLALERCVGPEVPLVEMSRLPIERSLQWTSARPQLAAAGFPIDGEPWWRGQRTSPPCRVTSLEQGSIISDCQVAAGYSGGPLFTIDPQSGRTVAYGITSARHPRRDRPVMLATPISAHADALRKSISAIDGERLR